MKTPYDQHRQKDELIDGILKRIVTDVDSDFCKTRGIIIDNDEVDSMKIPLLGAEACEVAGESLSAVLSIG